MCMMLGALLIPVQYELSNFFFSIYLLLFFFKEKMKFKVKLHIEVSSFPNQTWGR